MYPGHWAEIFPDKVAAYDSGDGSSITYGELNDRSNQLAQLLWDKGLRRGDHIAVFMENRLEYFVVAWAALRSGLYLTTVNRYLSGDEAAYIVENSESQAVIVSAPLAEIASEIPKLAAKCHTFLCVGGATGSYSDFGSEIAGYPALPLDEEPIGAFMLYSSGTTGRPKGILTPLREGSIRDSPNPLSLLMAGLWTVDQETIYLSPAPLYHSAPISACTGMQALGGTVVMMPRFDEVAALDAIETYRVTHSQWVPTMFTRMLKLPDSERLRFDLSSHKVAIHAAAPCPPLVKERMFEWWGPIIYEYYGGTELNGLTHARPEEWLERPGTVGKAILGVIHICDEEGNELPPGEAGIVYFELPEMPFEYLKDEEKTKEVQHSDFPNWSTLGDVGYVDDEGYLFLTDRATFMIISGGVNIYPQEIEDALIMHDKVADVAIIGVPNEDMGEEVKAVVQVVDGVEPDESLSNELIAFCRDRIAHYKCPRSVDYREELPRLPTGKLYKRLLKDEYWGRTGSRIV